MRGILWAIVMLLTASWVTLPLQSKIERQRLRLKFGGAPVTREMRDVMGQGMLIGVLAGFRGVVANFVWISSHGDWEKKRWFQQYNKMQVATMLQPRSVLFWDVGAWHMAWNIGYAERTDPRHRTLAEGMKREMLWHERARRFLIRGIQNLPNRYELYFKLGWLYEQKFKDPCLAAEQYAIAAQFTNAPAFIARMHCRNLAACGRLNEAYECWKRLWFDPAQTNHVSRSILAREIRKLEDEMNLSDSQRFFPRASRQPETQ